MRNLLVTGLLAGSTIGCSSDPPTPPPNVLLISIDTLRADRLGTYGYGVPTSPFLDRFAEGAVVFERCFSQSPKTAPSHMTMLTGLYPAAHGVKNFGREESARLAATVPTLASRLKERGYRAVAHTEGGNVGPSLGFDQGFERYEVNFPRSFSKARASLEELAAGDAPWFLFLHTYAAHDPYVPPDDSLEAIGAAPYDGPVEHDRKKLRKAGERGDSLHDLFWGRVDQRSDRDRDRLSTLYDAGIRWVDDRIAEVWADLERLGVADSTVVVITSDHGEEFFEHGRYMHNSMYEEVLHVPLVVRAPGAGAAPHRVHDIVRIVDVFPTVLDLTGDPSPPVSQGSSLVGLMRGEEESNERPVWSHWPTPDNQTFRWNDWKFIRTEFKARRREPTRFELYDLANDPGETNDLFRKNRAMYDRLAEAHARLAAPSNALRQRIGAGDKVTLRPGELEELEALGYLGEGN